MYPIHKKYKNKQKFKKVKTYSVDKVVSKVDSVSTYTKCIHWNQEKWMRSHMLKNKKITKKSQKKSQKFKKVKTYSMNKVVSKVNSVSTDTKCIHWNREKWMRFHMCKNKKSQKKHKKIKKKSQKIYKS